MMSTGTELRTFADKCQSCIHYPEEIGCEPCHLLMAVEYLGYTQDKGRLEVFNRLIDESGGEYRCKMYYRRQA